MKKIIVMMAVATLAVGAYARGCGGGWCRPCRPGPRPCHPCGGGDFWGRGGRNFWPGFVGGLISGAVANALTTPSTTVVTTPVVTTPVVTTPVVTTPVVTTPVVVSQPVVTVPTTTVVRQW